MDGGKRGNERLDEISIEGRGSKRPKDFLEYIRSN